LIFEGFYLDSRVPLGGGFDCELSVSCLDFYHKQVKTTRRKLTINISVVRRNLCPRGLKEEWGKKTAGCRRKGLTAQSIVVGRSLEIRHIRV
jgi:hypothetical protein